MYPLGVTTNSNEGLRNFFSKESLETFEAMQFLGMPLLIHGELDLPRTLVTKREEVFLPTFLRLADRFPKLKMVLEHITTKAAVATIRHLGPNINATITAHHLCTTLNDVVGDGIRPHNMCMPIPKDFEDRDALISAVISGNPKFFLGSDTAPHPREKKECARGACGVFSAPILPELLAEIFEKANGLSYLEEFACDFGAEFYGLKPATEKITLIKEAWTVPEIYGNVVPFMAGEALQWKLL